MKKYREVISGGIFFIFALAYLISAFQIKKFPDGFISSDFIPKILGVALMILSAIQILNGVCQLKKNINTPVEKSGMKKEAFITLGLLIVYIGLLKPVGFPIMTAMYIFLQSLLFTPKEKRNIIFAAVLSVVFSAAVYLLFVKCFTLTLPAGILG